MKLSADRIIHLTRCLFWAVMVCWLPVLHAQTYANVATTYNWIDAVGLGHAQVGYNTTPYKFNGGFGCGTTPPTIDDTISDQIPIGFNFQFGDKSFDSIRIQTNGRIQLTSTTLPLDNTTCGYGSPVQQLPIPNAGLNYTMRVYGSDMDPTLKSDVAGYNTNCTSRTGATPCFISYGNVGSVPGSRKFVVTFSNVPEWTTASTASGSYNVQIILLDNGNFIYQYGSDVAGPQSKLGQVAWQISTTNYDAPAVGYPVPNTAILFFVPHPVVEYLMEQASWSGPGAVLDTSGNAINGTPAGSAQPTPAAGGRVCRGANIPGVGVNGINTPVAIPTTIGNAGTIGFWYKSNSVWSGGSSTDAQLLDASTSTSALFFLVRRASTGDLRFVVTDSGGTVHSVETGTNAIAAGSWQYIAVTWNFNNIALANNDDISIFVNGVRQAQTQFSSTTLTLSTSIGNLTIGGNVNGVVAQNGTLNSANGVIDEFRAYNYEATAATITNLMNLNSGGCLNQYAVSVPASGLSCQASTITISPQNASGGAYTSNTQITLSTGTGGTGDWSLQNGLGTFTAGAVNTGSATYLFKNETQVVLSLSHPAAGSITISVSDGIYGGQSTFTIGNCAPGPFIACEITVPRCTPVAGSVAYANLYTKLANTGFSLDVAALKIDGTLNTSFTGTISVNLLASSAAPSSFSNTTGCPISPTATIPLPNVTLTNGRPPVTGAAVSSTAFSAVTPKYSAYPDVRVQFVCNTPTCSPAVTSCSPDAFTVRPLAFTVTSTNANADSAGASGTNSPIIPTGTMFSLTAGANTSGYFGTPTIDMTKVQWGGAPSRVGNLAGTFTTAASIGTGNGATGNFTYDEVGYFQFATGGVNDASYAAISGDVGNGDCWSFTNSGSNTTYPYSNVLINGKYGCYVSNQGGSNYFGRFVPDHLETTVIQTGVTPAIVPMGCPSGLTCPSNTSGASGSVYSGQPVSLEVIAKNSSGAVTQNYSGATFAKAITLSAVSSSGGSAIGAGTGLLSATGAPASSFSNGSNLASLAQPVFNFTTALTAPTNVYFRARDADGVTSLLSAASSSVEGGVNVLSGRVSIPNAYGSELLPYLCLFPTVQYYSGTLWVTSATDSVSTYNFAAPTIVKGPLTPAKLTESVAANATCKTGVDACGNTGAKTMCGGKAYVQLSPSGTAGAATIPLTTPTYLPSNSANVTFGIYKSPLIYRRENY